MNKLFIAIFIVVIIAGCATRPEQIQATPQPQILYGQLSCADLLNGKKEVAAEIEKYSKAQREKVDSDGVMFALGFLMPTMWISQASMNSDKSTEVVMSNLKGQDKAFSDEIKKRCE